MIVLIPEFVGKVSCLATHRRFPPSPLHKAGCCIWATVRRSSHLGQVMAVLESLDGGCSPFSCSPCSVVPGFPPCSPSGPGPDYT